MFLHVHYNVPSAFNRATRHKSRTNVHIFTLKCKKLIVFLHLPKKTSPPQGDITPRRGKFSSTCAESLHTTRHRDGERGAYIERKGERRSRTKGSFSGGLSTPNRKPRRPTNGRQRGCRKRHRLGNHRPLPVDSTPTARRDFFCVFF